MKIFKKNNDKVDMQFMELDRDCDIVFEQEGNQMIFDIFEWNYNEENNRHFYNINNANKTRINETGNKAVREKRKKRLKYLIHHNPHEDETHRFLKEYGHDNKMDTKEAHLIVVRYPYLVYPNNKFYDNGNDIIIVIIILL